MMLDFDGRKYRLVLEDNPLAKGIAARCPVDLRLERFGYAFALSRLIDEELHAFLTGFINLGKMPVARLYS